MKKYGLNERTLQNSRRRAGDKEIDNLYEAEFKTLVIRMLRELIELGQKMKEEMKTILSKIKQNIQGTNSKGK